jgi:hypothetical protein
MHQGVLVRTTASLRSSHFVAVPREATAEGTDTDTLTWDVRITRLVDEADGPAFLEGLLRSASGSQVLAQPAVTRLSPAVSIPWLGALRATRIPVHVRDGRTSAAGYIQVMSLGAGSTEVHLCLRGTSLLDRMRRWRRLGQLAELACDRLMPTPRA